MVEESSWCHWNQNDLSLRSLDLLNTFYENLIIKLWDLLCVMSVFFQNQNIILCLWIICSNLPHSCLSVYQIVKRTYWVSCLFSPLAGWPSSSSDKRLSPPTTWVDRGWWSHCHRLSLCPHPTLYLTEWRNQYTVHIVCFQLMHIHYTNSTDLCFLVLLVSMIPFKQTSICS